MQNDKSILVCKVPYNWYQVIKANFISNGSSYSNCWYTKMEEFNHDDDDKVTPAPGSMMLFVVEKDNRQYIVGGGYFFTHIELSADDCWYRYGVRAGYLSYDSFINRLKECHGSTEEKLSCYIATASFIFVRSQMVQRCQRQDGSLRHRSLKTRNRRPQRMNTIQTIRIAFAMTSR